eukprot:286334_1
MKQTVLQTDNAQYKSLKYEYDVHYDSHNSKHALLSKVVRNDCYDIKIKDNQFENVCNELKQSNPSLFTDNSHDDETHTNGMNYKSQLRTQKLVQYMCYDEHSVIRIHRIYNTRTQQSICRIYWNVISVILIKKSSLMTRIKMNMMRNPLHLRRTTMISQWKM